MQFVQSKSPHKQALITGVCLKVSSVEEAPLNHAPSSHSSLKLVLSIRKKTHFAISIMDKKSIVGREKDSSFEEPFLDRSVKKLTNRANSSHSAVAAVANQAKALYALGLSIFAPEFLRFEHAAGRKACHLLAGQIEHVEGCCRSHVHTDSLMDCNRAIAG